MVAGFAAMLGHVTSPLLRGRGGKGVATSLGAILAVQPMWACGLVVFVVFALRRRLRRYASRSASRRSVSGALMLVARLVLIHDAPPTGRLVRERMPRSSS